MTRVVQVTLQLLTRVGQEAVPRFFVHGKEATLCCNTNCGELRIHTKVCAKFTIVHCTVETFITAVKTLSRAVKTLSCAKDGITSIWFVETQTLHNDII